MTWLTKSPTPIPILTKDGELIFRSATPKSMQDGRWVHPGKDRQDFLTQIKNEAKGAIKEALIKELNALGKGRK
jgi:hypothetical protein